MKSVAFILVFTAWVILNSEQAKVKQVPEFQWGYTKFTCNASGVTAIKPLCKLRSLSRTVQSRSFGFELPKDVSDLFIKFTWSRKTVLNWRHLFTSPDIDLCSYFKVGKLVPFLDKLIDEYRIEFPQLPSSCPVKAGPYYALNHTGLDENNKRINLTKEGKLPDQPLPNGVYKVNLKFFNKNDPLIYNLEWQYFFKKRLGEEDF